MRKILKTLIFVLLMGILLAFKVDAQKRIPFKRGASSATVPGKLAGNGTKQFVVAAKRGQQITVTVKSRRKSVYLEMEASDVYETRRTYRTIDGDNFIGIFNDSSKSADYELTVTIK